ncbi:MAG: outer membrane beta-barrel protein [Planctomycetota bacterium]|nr:outer membrane beta-barrel protein [Planctomycetota bacterium]
MVCLSAGLTAGRAHGEEIPQIRVVGEEIVAEGADLRWGSMEFHPYLALNWEWIDNLFYEKKGGDDDTLVTASPGVHINWPFAGNHVAKLDLQTQLRHYFDNPEVNNHQDLSDALVKLDYDRFWLEFRGKYAYLQEVGDPQFTTRLARVVADASFQAGVRFERFDMIFGYEKRLRMWPRQRDHGLEYSEDRGHLTFDIKMTPTVQAFTRYEFHAVDYDGALEGGQIRRNDQNQGLALIGFRGTWGPSLGWSIAAGSEHVRLHQRNRTLADIQGETASDHPVIRASAVWDAIPERTKVKFSGTRDVALSVTSDYADTTSFRLEADHRWSQRLTSNAYAGYEFFNRAKGTDFKYYSAGLSTIYRITRWSSVYTRYEFQHRDTLDDPGAGDHKRNAVQIGVIFAW